MEYNHLQEIPIMALRNRLLLLHHISELFCPCIPMFDLEGRLGQTTHSVGSVGFDTLRGILISQGKVRRPHTHLHCLLNNTFIKAVITEGAVTFKQTPLAKSEINAYIFHCNIESYKPLEHNQGPSTRCVKCIIVSPVAYYY